MKVKHLERPANVAWSPRSQHPIYLAAGTAAQQLDASFNTSAALELYSLNLKEPGPDLELKGTASSEHRFHKIIWSDQNNGTIIGGCDGGFINIYSAQKILNGENGLVKTQDKHTGPVHALDFNAFQPNLFATGASDSEIFIWDLNKVSTPMSPGAKTQPLEDVLSVAWNRQVQHILSSTFASKSVIWDLRKNEPIIKLTDTVSRVRWKDVAWHPEVATQLCLASEEDHSPIIQVWDLRFATSPLKALEHHQRGVLSIAWCQDDSDLLVSSGKDNMILCWNPNSNHPGEDLTEIARTNQWIFDIQWCPRNPAIIACPSFDGHVGIYSLMGGRTPQVQTSSKIADSFPGMDGFVQAPVPQQMGVTSKDLIKPPKWLKRPVGASFGFGGKLITFENDKVAIAEAQHNTQPGQPIMPVHRTVQISQVITEPDLVQHSTYLEESLQAGHFIEYCELKADEANDPHKRNIWQFLKASFDVNPRAEILSLIGYKIEHVNNKLNQVIGVNRRKSIESPTNQFSNMNRIEDFADNDEPFNAISKPKSPKFFKIKTGDDTEGYITQALLMGNLEAAVELCFKANRYADAIIIAMTGGTDLLARTQHKYLEQSEGYVSSLISALVSEDWASIISNCDTASWKEALAATLTHSSDEELPVLCEQLGARLEASTNHKLAQDAQLCYICSGSFEKLVNSWTKKATGSTEDLQELVELVSFLQKAVERQGRQVRITGALADLLSQYASILAAQGNLSAALTYLGYSEDPKVVALRDRLLVNLGQKPSYSNLATRRSTSYSDSSKFPYKSPFSPVGQAPIQTQPPLAGPMGGFNTGLPNSAVSSGFGQPPLAPIAPPSQLQPIRTFSPAPAAPLVHPPRPSSVSSNHGSSGLPSRKYVLDPSVSSTPSYGNLPPQSMNQFQSLPSVPTYQPQSFQPLPSAGPVPQPSSFQPPANTFQPSAFQPPLAAGPMFSRYSRNASRTQSFSESETGGDVAQVPYSFAGPGDTSNVYTNGKVETTQNSLHNAPSGWNDPPPAFARSSRAQSKPDITPLEPITHPIYGSVPAQTVPMAGNNPPNMGGPPPGQQFNNSAMPPPPPTSGFGQSVPLIPSQQTPAFPTSFTPNNFNQNAINAMNFNQNVGNIGMPEPGPAQESVKQKPQPVQKPPIPEQHIHMKTVFDALREKCSCVTNNPQVKRKLEDVGRKLETLYDLLREQTLSQNTLSSLHQIVALIQQGNYNGGLQLCSQLASGTDFSQIASFIPGIKILLTCASQLQVYLS